jgi:hypothetical protein
MRRQHLAVDQCPVPACEIAYRHPIRRLPDNGMLSRNPQVVEHQIVLYVSTDRYLGLSQLVAKFPFSGALNIQTRHKSKLIVKTDVRNFNT